MLFEFTRHLPEEDVGPVLDERDISAIFKRTQALAKANVCNVVVKRVSPEDHPELKLSQDSQNLLITSCLNMEIVDKIRPARVNYVINIPSRKWLKDRQEFIKLSSIARTFCTIECLEQLRRNSLDDYWRIVESWGKEFSLCSLEETKLIAEINIAARNLYSLRFKNIWRYNYSSLSFNSRMAWKFLLTLDVWQEITKQNYSISLKNKQNDMVFAHVFYRTYCRIKILFIAAGLWSVRKYLNSLKYSMHLLPISSTQLEDLILFGLSRNFNHSIRSQL